MENSCNLSNLHVDVWGFREAKGLAYTAAEQGFSFILDLFSGIPRKSWWIAWGVERIALHCIALHGMIDEARKTLKRARNVSMNLDTQSFSGLGCRARRTLIQSSDSDSASASANTRRHAIIRCLGCSLSAGS